MVKTCFYEKVIIVKADVVAPLFCLSDIDDAASGGVESCQGRRLLAFILTSSSVPERFPASDIVFLPHCKGSYTQNCPRARTCTVSESTHNRRGQGFSKHVGNLDFREKHTPRTIGGVTSRLNS